MILAMYVIGERTTERDEACSGSGGRKPSFGDDQAQQIRQTHSRLRAQNTGLGMEVDEPVDAAHIDQHARAIEAGVAIGSPQADGQFAGGALIADQGWQFVAKARPGNALRLARNAPPGQHVAIPDESKLLHDVCAPALSGAPANKAAPLPIK